MSAITTHVLDTARGRPAAGVPVVLEARIDGDRWQRVGAGQTDTDGRLRTLMPDAAPLVPGIYRLTFDTASYFGAAGVRTLYPSIVIAFEAEPGESHYHVPLLVAPFGYSTYRGT
jgi:5-hydroxyisourate hydrolase